jgi:hypothetical protein
MPSGVLRCRCSSIAARPRRHSSRSALCVASPLAGSRIDPGWLSRDGRYAINDIRKILETILAPVLSALG